MELRERRYKSRLASGRRLRGRGERHNPSEEQPHRIVNRPPRPPLDMAKLLIRWGPITIAILIVWYLIANYVL